MDLNTLKSLEKGLLASSRTSLIEKGRAYAAIVSKCRNWSGDYLSDDVLISDMAEIYIREELQHYKVNNKPVHLEHIKAAKQFIISDFLAKKDVIALLSELPEPYTYAQARSYLSSSDDYSRIKPTTVREIMEGL